MKKILIFLLLISTANLKQAFAQDTSIADLLNLNLPPLQTLLDGANKSSMVEFYEYRMEGEELTLKTEKRRWLGYFSGFATYQYGVMGLNNYSNVADDLPIYQYTASAQIWYNAGAAIRISLDELFDRRNRIRRQQLKINETMKEKEMWYDEQKREIIRLYYEAQKTLNTLKYAVENYNLANTQYEMAQGDYIRGNSTMHSLATSKGMQVQTFLQMEEIKASLNIFIGQLEIISKTKILY